MFESAVKSLAQMIRMDLDSGLVGTDFLGTRASADARGVTRPVYGCPLCSLVYRSYHHHHRTDAVYHCLHSSTCTLQPLHYIRPFYSPLWRSLNMPQLRPILCQEGRGPDLERLTKRRPTNTGSCTSNHRQKLTEAQ
ncbi:unnamed protein product [Protopolystoma xenopodis]|uniref:Uncharacterized protein n=1 Tax=Protopolystoma xenopodis TaxID=117903 RepID=A0A448XBT3_9PLAT|nr:unnamed protein product [Protopolystoma xenopodis]